MVSAIVQQSAVARHPLDEQEMVALGSELGTACRSLMDSSRSTIIFLEGDLGMGKTTLSRGVLQAFGHQGTVKSPTYTLVEPYQFAHVTVYHFDLYRLGDPEELEYMGIRDYFDGNSLCLVEWPEKAGMFLPTADLVVRIATASNTTGREVMIYAQTDDGKAIVNRLSAVDNNQSINDE